MESKILVIATTFPRWRNDVSPRFVYDLSNSLASNYKITVLVPHHKGAKKQENIQDLIRIEQNIKNLNMVKKIEKNSNPIDNDVQ